MHVSKLYHMNKKILIVMIALLMPFGIFAQGKPGGTQPTPEERANRTVSGLSSKITLTKVQQDSLTKIYTDFFRGMQKARQSENKDLMKKQGDIMDARVKKNLTPAQYKEYQKIVEEERAKRQQGGGQRPPH
jgi:hypothetical protein